MSTPSLKQICALNRRIYKLWPPKWYIDHDGAIDWTYGAIYYQGVSGLARIPMWMLDGITPITYEMAKFWTREEERRRRNRKP